MEVKYIEVKRVEVTFDEHEELVTIHGHDPDGKAHSICFARTQFTDLVASFFDSMALIGSQAVKRAGSIRASFDVNPSPGY